MLSKSEEPVFILETRDRSRFGACYTDDDIEDFINLGTPYKKIVLTSHERYKNSPNVINNTKILYFNDRHPELPPDTKLMAKELYNAFKSEFDVDEKKEDKSLPKVGYHIIY